MPTVAPPSTMADIKKEENGNLRKLAFALDLAGVQVRITPNSDPMAQDDSLDIVEPRAKDGAAITVNSPNEYSPRGAPLFSLTFDIKEGVEFGFSSNDLLAVTSEIKRLQKPEA